MKRSGIDLETGRSITVEFSERIHAIVPSAETGAYLIPGMIDIQVNGFAGVDFNSPQLTEEQIGVAAEAIRRTGVTRFLPTVITGPREDMVAALRRLAQSRDVSIAGFHIEGPFLSGQEGPRGAHPVDSIRAPDLKEYRGWQEVTGGRVRVVTVSPHWPGVTTFIETLTAEGVAVSIGHTHASAEQVYDAVSAGAVMSTHLGNAAHSPIRKQPNYIWDQMAEDRLMASFIVDGIHLGGAFLKSGIRAKGLERSILVTDASAPAGAQPGRYKLGKQDVDLTPDGRVVLAGSERLAGSALTMNAAVRNVVELAQVRLSDAVRMATVNPARAIRLSGHERGLVVGQRADLVVLSKTLEVQETIVSN